jgi:hypothetical protein
VYLVNLTHQLRDEVQYGTRSIFFGERSLQEATVSFLDHFHAERNHQGIGNRLITPGEEVRRITGEVACRERLGGTLRYYYRKAA